MRAQLHLHRDSQCDALTGIAVEATRAPGGCGLFLRFSAHGTISEIARRSLGHPKRANDLWKTTCFEGFLQASAEADYCEFNFSPSAEWAAYGFTAYREGMHDLAIAAPAIKVSSNSGELGVSAEIDLGGALNISKDSIWWLGVSAIIEETNGRISYWALRHPPGKPDFHHPDCFALELPPP